VLTDHFPLLGLQLNTPRLQLRLPDPDELAALAGVAATGIHDPELMPFTLAWTDQPPAERARSVVRAHWATLGAWTPHRWVLPLAVFHSGHIVGLQELKAFDFAVRREVSTFSWLGLEHHGQGIGTEMRAAVLHLAFAELGAQEAVSAAFVDNPASIAVSRKLGYAPDGVQRDMARGELRVSQRLRLTRTRWRSPVAVTVGGIEACREDFGVQVSAR
jgi:RimJ/RimL family protein N-acetyltransferase